MLFALFMQMSGSFEAHVYPWFSARVRHGPPFRISQSGTRSFAFPFHAEI